MLVDAALATPQPYPQVAQQLFHAGSNEGPVRFVVIERDELSRLACLGWVEIDTNMVTPTVLRYRRPPAPPPDRADFRRHFDRGMILLMDVDAVGVFIVQELGIVHQVLERNELERAPKTCAVGRLPVSQLVEAPNGRRQGDT
jgi:hypothetical protein